MFFKNLVFFRFPSAMGAQFVAEPDGRDPLHAALSEHLLCAVGAMELSSRGFVSPYSLDSQELAVRSGAAAWITLGGEDKLLTPAAINKAVYDRMKAASERIGLQISGKQRRAFREEAISEMLPRAFAQAVRGDAYFDFARGLLVVDTSSRKTAEGMVSNIRTAIGSFPALPLSAEVAPRAILTAWLAGEPLPSGFSLGEECELRSAHEHGGIVRCQRVDLQDEDVAKHLESGMQCTRLGLIYNDHVSFVLGDDLVIRKVRFLDGVVDRPHEEEHDTVKQELNARFALMAGEIGLLFDALAGAFKFSAPDEPEKQPGSVREDPASARRKRRLGADIESVTISRPGGKSVTMTGEQFSKTVDLASRLDEVAKVIRLTGKTSISYWQRQLKCGYNEAARLLETMESLGVVSPPAHNGDRTVLPLKDPA